MYGHTLFQMGSWVLDEEFGCSCHVWERLGAAQVIWDELRNDEPRWLKRPVFKFSADEAVGWNCIKFGGFRWPKHFFFFFSFPPCVGTDFSPAFISLARIDRLCCRSACEDFIYHSLASSRWYFILELWDPFQICGFETSDGSGATKLDDVTRLGFLFHPCFSCLWL